MSNYEQMELNITLDGERELKKKRYAIRRVCI